MQALGKWLISLSAAHNDLCISKKRWRSRHPMAAWWWIEVVRWMAVGILGGLVTIFSLASLMLAEVIYIGW